MKRQIIQYVGAVVMFFCLQSASSAEEPSKAFTAYQDGAGQVVRLADEETVPFLHVGKPVLKYDANDPDATYMVRHKKHYAKSIVRFASVRDCLIDSEQKVPQPDLTKFDWKKITDETEAAVCVFRIAGSYALPDDMKRWFMSQGFRTSLHKDRNRDVFVSASWSTDQYAARSGENIFTKTWIKMVAHGFSLGVEYVLDSELHHVRASFTVL